MCAGIRSVCVCSVCVEVHHGAHLGGACVLDALLEAQLARLQLDDLDAAEQLAHQPRALVARQQQRLLLAEGGGGELLVGGEHGSDSEHAAQQ